MNEAEVLCDEVAEEVFSLCKEAFLAICRKEGNDIILSFPDGKTVMVCVKV